MSDAPGSVSLARLLLVLAPVAIVAGVIGARIPSYEKKAQAEFEQNMLERLLADVESAPKDSVEFVDADGDLVCDSPADDKCRDPEKLVFAYIAAPEETDEPETWADVIATLSEATGKRVEIASYTTTADQLAAMARGELDIAGLNTGAAPTAVEKAGFIPVCTLGHDDGTFGYTMKIITPAKGGVDSLDDLRGKKIVFTRPDSNSGFKAALVLLMDEHKLLPERDYRWGFSFDHETSIRETAAGEHDAAPVASDILDRVTNDGEVSADAYRVVYESERFPPAVIGFAHDLTPSLRERIAQTLLGFDWAGSSVEKKYGSSGVTKFVPVSYKNDWANIRRIDQAVAAARAE